MIIMRTKMFNQSQIYDNAKKNCCFVCVYSFYRKVKNILCIDDNNKNITEGVKDNSVIIENPLYQYNKKKLNIPSNNIEITSVYDINLYNNSIKMSDGMNGYNNTYGCGDSGVPPKFTRTFRSVVDGGSGKEKSGTFANLPKLKPLSERNIDYESTKHKSTKCSPIKDNSPDITTVSDVVTVTIQPFVDKEKKVVDTTEIPDTTTLNIVKSIEPFVMETTSTMVNDDVEKIMETIGDEKDNSIMTFNDLLTNLKIIERVKEGDKLYKDGRKLNIDNRWLMSFRRWATGDSGDVTVNFIEQIYENCKQTCEELSMKTSDESDSQHKLDQLTTEIRNCKHGLEQLKKTYATHNNTSINARIEIFIDNFRDLAAAHSKK